MSRGVYMLMLSYRGLSCIYKQKQSSEEDVQFWKTTCLEKQTIIKGETSSQLEDSSWDPSLLILPPDVYIYSRLLFNIFFIDTNDLSVLFRDLSENHLFLN